MGKIFLIPTTLDPALEKSCLSTYDLQKINHLENFLVETEKVARAHLKSFKLATPLPKINLFSSAEPGEEFWQKFKAGFDFGLLSDSGYPCIADPGTALIRKLHDFFTPGFKVQPLSGPSAIFMALASSGLSGQQFTFHGYLPIPLEARLKSLQSLERAACLGYTQIFIETPYRATSLLNLLRAKIKPELFLSLAVDLMGKREAIYSKQLKFWQENALDLKGKEVIFLIGN